MCQLKSEGGRCNGHLRTSMRLKQRAIDRSETRIGQLEEQLKNGDEKAREKLNKAREKNSQLKKELEERQDAYLDNVAEKGLRLPGKNQSAIDRHKKEMQELMAVAYTRKSFDKVTGQFVRSGEVVRDWVRADEAYEEAYQERNMAIRECQEFLSYMDDRVPKGREKDFEYFSMNGIRERPYSLYAAGVKIVTGLERDDAWAFHRKATELYDLKNGEESEEVKRAYSDWVSEVKGKLGFGGLKNGFVEGSMPGARKNIEKYSQIFPSSWTGGDIYANTLKKNSRAHFIKRPIEKESNRLSFENRKEYIRETEAEARKAAYEELEHAGIAHDVNVDDIKVVQVENLRYRVSVPYVDRKFSSHKPAGDGWAKFGEDKGRFTEWRRAARSMEFNKVPVVSVTKHGGSYDRGAAIHELVHYAEDSRPELGLAQKAYLEYRIHKAGDKARRGKVGPRSNEIGTLGVFDDNYLSKDYSSAHGYKHFEILSTTLGEELGWERRVKIDEETKNFSWGVLFSS